MKKSDSVENRIDVVEVHDIKLEMVTIRIVGVTELLQNRFREADMASIADKQTGKAAVREFRDPNREFEEHAHVFDAKKKIYGHPGAAIKNCIVAAGGRFADKKMSELRGLFNVTLGLVPIEGDSPVMRTDWGCPKYNVTTIIYRPSFKKWAMAVPVIYNASRLSAEEILNLFNVAGFSIGLGAYRPERKGICGQFKVAGVVNG